MSSRGTDRLADVLAFLFALTLATSLPLKTSPLVESFVVMAIFFLTGGPSAKRALRPFAAVVVGFIRFFGAAARRPTAVSAGTSWCLGAASVFLYEGSLQLLQTCVERQQRDWEHVLMTLHLRWRHLRG